MKTCPGKITLYVIKQNLKSNRRIMYKLKNVLHEYILLILYNALISSHLNYGLFAWRIQTNQIEILQKKKQFVLSLKALS